MKKVLILSCSTGMGHNSCAQAVADYFEEAGVSCQIRDALGFISPETARFISWGHSWIYRHLPGLFRWGYGFSEKRPGLFDGNTPAYRFLTSGGEEMADYIKSQGFDTVIATHVFSALMLTDALKECSLPVQTAFVGTDYTCSPCTEASDLQHYFIPAEALKADYVRKGIPADRITASGIPLRSQFEKPADKTDAKRLLGLPADSPHLLIACGSMGCGPIPKIVRQVSKAMTENMEVSVICGTNGKLQKRLTRMCRKNSRIHIIGYTNQMALYLDSADLYMTKPGGISVTEAAHKSLPMAFINAVDGCESYNMKFFLEHGCAVTADSPQKLVASCMQLLTAWDKRSGMARQLREYAKFTSAAIIFRELNGGISNEQRKYG